VGGLVENFSSGTDYLRTLLTTFSAVYKDTEHLACFYIILPALSINFVKHMLKSKDGFSKRGKEEGIFSDDGFVIGLAFLLAVLGQNIDFNSLHWFESADEYYEQEKSDLNSKSKEKKKAAQFTTDKLDRYQKEYLLLKYSFESARIFFI